MSWQKCPICEGTGKDTNSAFNRCPVCNGTRIISELTGKPPKDIIVNEVKSTNDTYQNIASLGLLPSNRILDFNNLSGKLFGKLAKDVNGSDIHKVFHLKNEKTEDEQALLNYIASLSRNNIFHKEVRLFNDKTELGPDEGYFKFAHINEPKPFISFSRLLLVTNIQLKKDDILELQNGSEIYLTEDSVSVGDKRYASTFGLVTEDANRYVDARYVAEYVIFKVVKK